MAKKSKKDEGEPITYKFRDGEGPISFEEVPNASITDPKFWNWYKKQGVPISELPAEWRRTMQEALEDAGMSFPGGDPDLRARVIEQFVAAGGRREHATGVLNPGVDLKHPSSNWYAWQIWMRLDKAMSFWPQTEKYPPDEYAALGMAFQAGMHAATLRLLALDKIAAGGLRAKEQLDDNRETAVQTNQQAAEIWKAKAIELARKKLKPSKRYSAAEVAKAIHEELSSWLRDQYDLLGTEEKKRRFPPPDTVRRAIPLKIVGKDG
ncbi:MAG: hypothetical protein J0J10_17925 [Bosea sp.]|uniref:hypothetical protein n=1 Tax=Bosea sp. (in: a-proteobacteria) TaxID=1871050 RepID=UPI001AC5CEFE|nr:hypothetical protein [Bosea sp. (in: a-proteobacteria)]MBN9470647.1 hypothetical protein [Bosea sp. (in: a-proteobacteria)]